MGFPTSFSSTTIVGPPDPSAPVASVLDYIDGALQEHDADITGRGDGYVDFKVPIVARVARTFVFRWRLGSTSWPLSFVGSGSFSAAPLRDRVLVTADLRITQYLLTRGALFGLLTGAITASNGALFALVVGASIGLGVSAVSYALAKWEFGFWFQRLDRLLKEAREAAA
jgi:hypothetical protein